MLYRVRINTFSVSIMIDLRQLRYFVTLADTLHFGRAAAQLHISQPPLSRQIAALEESIGVELVARNSRHVALTPAGRHFHEQAVRLFQSIEAAVNSTRAVARGERGVLHVGFTMSAAWNVMPPLTRIFGESHADVRLQLTEVLPSELGESLLSGVIDVGIAFSWQRADGLEYMPIHTEPLCAVLPKNHRLARQEVIDVVELAGEPFVTVPVAAAPALFELVMGCCRDHGFEPHIRLQTLLQQTIVNLVAEGLGVSLVPQSMGKIRLEGAVFRPVGRPRIVEQGVIWAARNSNPCLTPFLNCAKVFGAERRV